MKRYVALFVLVLCAFALTLAGCGYIDAPFETEPNPTGPYPTDPYPVIPDTTPTTDQDEPVPDVVEVVDIVDQTKDGDICTADALEGFYSDDTYDYYFPSIKSGYIIVHYSDGTTQPVTEALADGRVTIADLDRFEIGYYKESKIETDLPLKEVRLIYEVNYSSVRIPCAKEFFRDSNYLYYVPCYDTDIRIEYADGSLGYASTDLGCGYLTIDDLDRFGIEYFKIPWGEFGKSPLINIMDLYSDGYLEAGEAEQEFYRDENYVYFFSSWIKDIVLAVYEDGSTEAIWKALKAGRVTIEDIDRFEIAYFTESNQYKGTPGVKVIYDREASGKLRNDFGGGMYDDTFDAIYEDDKYWYVLHTPYEAAVVVIYADDTMESVGDALVAGRITIADLDKWDIRYERYPK